MPPTRWPRLGTSRRSAAKKIWAKGKDAKFDIARIDEIERETKHDVIAFLTHLAEIVGPEARFVHQGMTSSDVLDTCLAVQLARAADMLIADVDALLAALKRRAFEHKNTADHRPQPRHPCRADHVRAEARRLLCRVLRAPAAAGTRRAKRSRPAPSRARSAPSPMSTRGSKAYVAEKARAYGRADLDPGDSARPPRDVISPRSAWSRPRSSGWRPKSATCSAPKCSRPRNFSRRAKRAPRPCRTSAIRCCRKI